MKCSLVSGRSLTAPASFDDAITVSAEHIRRIRAVRAVYLDTAIAHESEYGIPVNRIAAFAKAVFHPRHIVVDNQYVAFSPFDGFFLFGRMRHKGIGTATSCTRTGIASLLFLQFMRV